VQRRFPPWMAIVVFLLTIGLRGPKITEARNGYKAREQRLRMGRWAGRKTKRGDASREACGGGFWLMALVPPSPPPPPGVWLASAKH